MRKRFYRATAVILAAFTLCPPMAYAAEVVGAASTVTTAETEDTEESVESQLLKDQFGAVTLYRWEKFTGSASELYKKLDEWTPIMLEADGSYISGVPRDCLYGSNEYSENAIDDWQRERFGYSDMSVLESIKGKEWFNTYIYKDDIKWGRITYNNGYKIYDDSGTVLIRSDDRSYNYKNKDNMVKTDRQIFYTDDDRNCLFAKYEKSAEDRQGCVHFLMKKPAAGEEYEVFSSIWTDNDYTKRRAGLIVQKRTAGPIMGFPVEKAGNETYRFYRVFDYCNPPFNSYLNLVDDVTYMEVNRSTAFTVFIGTEHHFSSLKGDTTIKDGQVLSVSEADYIAADGAEWSDGQGNHTVGCFIPNGTTLTIESGGVLVISGNLLNDGTIINNGGTILIRNGGSISSFLAGKNIAANGCGTLKCNGGDILIEKGGSLYAGMCDADANIVPFSLDNNSTLINCGLLVYGQMNLGEGARFEMRDGSKTIGGVIGDFEYVDKLYKKLVNNLNQTQWTMKMKEEFEAAGYRTERITSGKTSTLYVYEKVPGNIDTDYDILSYYDSKILSASSGIPSDCLGIKKSDGYGANITAGSSRTSILKWPLAKLEDDKLKGLVTDKADL